MIDEPILDRATRGLTTPDDGSEEGARLTPVEIAPLIHQAPIKQNWRRWTEDEVIDASAEMVDEFEGQKIDAALYTQYRVDRGWPSNPTWQKLGRFRDLVVVEKGGSGLATGGSRRRGALRSCDLRGHRHAFVLKPEGEQEASSHPTT